MVYTSYFGNIQRILKSEHNPVTFVSIAGKSPDWFAGTEKKMLAPSYDIFKEYKETGDINQYTKRFYAERLAQLDPDDTLLELIAASGNFKGFNYLPNTILLCYETPDKFCHRHLVADWLNKATNVQIVEYGTQMF